LAQKMQVGPCIYVRIQLNTVGKAEDGPTSGPTRRLSHSGRKHQDRSSQPGESSLLYGLSYNSPYNPPHNKRILDEDEERITRSSLSQGVQEVRKALRPRRIEGMGGGAWEEAQGVQVNPLKPVSVSPWPALRLADAGRHPRHVVNHPPVPEAGPRPDHVQRLRDRTAACSVNSINCSTGGRANSCKTAKPRVHHTGTGPLLNKYIERLYIPGVSAH
jgi:hypothetical protein